MTRARNRLLKAKHETADSRNLEEYRDIADDVIESDFVPYACLYDADSIATKDGEVLQIIKITGHGFDAKAQGDLRAAIRSAIRTHIPSVEYAIWMHTLRRHRNLLTRAHFPDKFSGQVDEAWRTQHPASLSYVNELYITIVRAGEPASMRNKKAFLQSLWPPRDRDLRNDALAQRNNELGAVCTKILAQLAPFGAKRLTVVDRDGQFFSEQLEFLEKLINLEERPMPVPERDLSQVLTSGEITFGFNAMEVRTAENHRRFASILTVKEYKESTLPGIDQFLDIPCEVIITQCFDFVGEDTARDAYATQARYLGLSGDKELRQWIEIDRLTQQGVGARLFGEQQTSIFLIAPTINQLEANVRLTQKAMARLGMVMVREDLRFEDCYWAQLPGNFSFISRKKSVDTEHLAGFVNLQTAPMGNSAGTPWGPPVTLCTTLQDKPYFFNFHRDALLHTIILGKAGTGRTTFTHFLLAQSRKFSTRVWYLDTSGRVGSFLTALGGTMHIPGSAPCGLNPFALPDSPTNREFLALFLSTLVDPSGTGLTRSSLEFFQSLVAAAMQLPAPQRRLTSLLPPLRNADPALANAIARYCEGGEFGGLFDAPTDTLALGPLCGWDISGFMQNDATRVPLVSYLLHRMTAALDGTATQLVLAEGFRLLDTPLFGPRAAGWCDYLAQRNTAIIFNIEDVDTSSQYNFAAAVSAKAASIFAMPNPHAGGEYAMGFGLSESDIASIGYIDRRHHQVLLKRGEESTVLKLNLDSLGPELLTTLTARRAPVAPQRSAADMLAELMGYGEKVGT
ncbi:MAG: hypothetical protein ACKVOE_01685 [Rickettsiales bacterium]